MNFLHIFFEKVQNNSKVVFYPKRLKNLNSIKQHKNICVVGSENIGKSYLIRKAYIKRGIQPRKYQNILSKDKQYPFYRYQNFFEINCSHLGYKDKHILYHFINDISTSHKKANEDNIIYIRNIHTLTLDAMYTLRGLIDQFENTVHFVFSSNTSQSLPKSLLSRMILFTMGPLKITSTICKHLKIPTSQKKTLESCFKKHNNKIDISLLDFWNLQQNHSTYDGIIQKFSRDIYLFAQEDFCMKKVIEFRELVYTMMLNQIPYEKILELLYLGIQQKKECSLLELWSECNLKLQECYRPIFIFELFWLKATQMN